MANLDQTTLVELVDTPKKDVDTSRTALDTPVTERPEDPNKGKQLNYLALGDSYTIGEAVNAYENFPSQLVNELQKQGLIINPPKIIAQTGWTTAELKDAIATSGVIQKFSFVTLLIGVNNQYRGQSQETYRSEFKELLQTALEYVSNNKTHVFVVSIPDWGVTPFARQSDKDAGLISREINAFNSINKEETLALGISYTDITEASRNAASDLSLIASDGLHPSAKMYNGWATALAPAIVKVFK